MGVCDDERNPRSPSARQIFLKDVKSSNGTFINSERLSGEAMESEPVEVRTDDIVVRTHPSLLSSPFPFHVFFLGLSWLRSLFLPRLALRTRVSLNEGRCGQG